MWAEIKRFESPTLGQSLFGPISPVDSGSALHDADWLRRRVTELVQKDPLRYLSQAPARVEPIGPGGMLGGHNVDYCGLRLVAPGGQDFVMNVTKMYMMIRSDLRAETIDRCLLHMLKSAWEGRTECFMSWEEARSRLLPVVRGPHRHKVVGFGWGDLKVNLVVDSPDQMFYVSPERLDAWGVTAEQVLAQAKDNLRRRYGRVKVRKLPLDEAEGNHIWAVDSDPDYSTSLILLPSLVAQVPLNRRDMYVIMPQRHQLFFVDKPADGLKRVYLFYRTIGMFETGAYPVSPFLHVWSGQKLTLASADEITCGDRRFQRDGGVFVPTGEPGKLKLRLVHVQWPPAS